MTSFNKCCQFQSNGMLNFAPKCLYMIIIALIVPVCLSLERHDLPFLLRCITHFKTSTSANITIFLMINDRRETGKQAVVINDMLELFEKMGAGNLTPEQTLKEFVGHTPMQVFAGGLLGIIVALVLNM